MDVWKHPPKAKVYEAMSAVADGRVRITGETEADVVSSSGTKTYKVTWTPDRTAFGSNDNASFWQGYVGYPIIAVMLAVGELPYDPDIAQRLVLVPWKELNDKYKRDYDKVVELVLMPLGDDADTVRALAERIFQQLATKEIGKLNSPGRPPKK